MPVVCSIAATNFLKIVSDLKCGYRVISGVSPGTVIITSQAFNGLLEPYFLQVSLTCKQCLVN